MGALVDPYWGGVQGCYHVGTARQTAFTACAGDLFSGRELHAFIGAMICLIGEELGERSWIPLIRSGPRGSSRPGCVW